MGSEDISLKGISLFEYWRRRELSKKNFDLLHLLSLFCGE